MASQFAAIITSALIAMISGDHGTAPGPSWVVGRDALGIRSSHRTLKNFNTTSEVFMQVIEDRLFVLLQFARLCLSVCRYRVHELCCKMPEVLAIDSTKPSSQWSDSLAYIDQLSKAERENAEALIRRECAVMRSEGHSVDKIGHNIPDVSRFLKFDVRDLPRTCFTKAWRHMLIGTAKPINYSWTATSVCGVGP